MPTQGAITDGLWTPLRHSISVPFVSNTSVLGQGAGSWWWQNGIPLTNGTINYTPVGAASGRPGYVIYNRQFAYAGYMNNSKVFKIQKYNLATAAETEVYTRNATLACTNDQRATRGLAFYSPLHQRLYFIISGYEADATLPFTNGVTCGHLIVVELNPADDSTVLLHEVTNTTQRYLLDGFNANNGALFMRFNRATLSGTPTQFWQKVTPLGGASQSATNIAGTQPTTFVGSTNVVFPYGFFNNQSTTFYAPEAAETWTVPRAYLSVVPLVSTGVNQPNPMVFLATENATPSRLYLLTLPSGGGATELEIAGAIDGNHSASVHWPDTVLVPTDRPRTLFIPHGTQKLAWFPLQERDAG